MWFLAERRNLGMVATVNQNIGGITSPHPGGAHVAMGDGAVRFLREDMSQRTLGALLGRQDGTVINGGQL